MPKYIDLTHAITHGMPVYPNDDQVKLYKNRYLAKDHYNDTRLESGMHAGTHIDLPSHLTDRQMCVAELAVDHFIGNGCLLDVRNQDVITMKEEYHDLVQENDIVLLYTGFDQYYGQERYYTQHPVVALELAEFFLTKKIKILGMDLPGPDRYPFPVHQMLFNKDIFIIENMTNLDQLLQVTDFQIIAFPLKIEAEASPVRVVAEIKA